MPRPNNLAVESPAQSQPTSVASTTTCESTKELTDNQWESAKYNNFRHHVRSFVSQEPKLGEWADWLDRLPLSVFLAGGDGELAGVRGASDSTNHDKGAEEAGLVLERWALQYDFDLGRITAADKLRLTRYLLLFSAV